ncbi:MAG: Maf family protein [Candidatus Hodarchaeales archaeon]|jgi:septum formation protein
MDSSFPTLILASNSPARAKVLSQINFDYLVIPSDVDENISMENPYFYVRDLAFSKASTVGMRIKSEYNRYIVLGCDTIVINKKQRVIGKPRDSLEAEKMLKLLSGSTHLVVTGYSIIIYPEEISYQEIVTTEVIFRNLLEVEINHYLATNEWKGKAGGYAIQGLGSLLIKEIKGDFYNVVGLPVNSIWQTLLDHYGKHLIKYVKEKGEKRG